MNRNSTLYVLLLSLLLLGGCASQARFPDNPPLAAAKPTLSPITPDSTVLLMTLSGGGSRASAFAYGVMEALHQTPLTTRPDAPTLLDKVDLISAVSGGSIIAAYYGLHGDRLFERFRDDFLKQNVRDEIRQRMLSLENLSRLSSTTFGSGDILDEYFREKLFGERPLSELFDDQGPVIIINATDLFKGSRFGFTPELFSLICSDNEHFPVARAVAASSAVPLIFTPITLTNRAGSCGAPVPEWVRVGLTEKAKNPRRYRLARTWSRYLNRPEHPYVHLLDGGLADNLGLRAMLDQIIIHDGLDDTLKHDMLAQARRIVLIEIDAAARLPSEWEKKPDHPPQTVILDAASTTPLSNYNFETKAYLHSQLEPWLRQNGAAPCRDQARCQPELYIIEINLDDSSEQLDGQPLSTIPTDFNLPEQAAERLIEAGNQLLRQHPEFSRLLKDLYAEMAGFR
ncbi:patatin-like phospholipase family protein [Sedimenticola hydrogenitrophicus]|uniref:patatin-like phospholipase family protein n=1 Tax=Sedimenticola hydrogenitrophicus TaxID=2967975 RepID=UPI0021A295AF|nr:patatin-like phospholipase family protein [Sedimenticola hydrogenitrophicus]